MININCRQNDQGVWCKDSRVKRSLFGIGARMCPVFESKQCEFQIEYKCQRPEVQQIVGI